MKCEASQELVVGGFTDPQGARVGLGALLVGYYEGDDFVFAGKLGTGFDTQAAARSAASASTRSRYRPRRSRRPPACPACARTGSARRSSCRSAFIEWTVHGKLRHPRLLGVRFDKDPREVVTGSSHDHASREGALPRRRHHEGRSGGLLRSHRAGDAAAPARPAGHDGALPGRASARRGSGRRTSRRDFPRGCERVEVPKKDGVVHYPVITDLRSLLWVTNQNTITQHVWTSRVPEPRLPGSLRLRSRSVERRSGGRCARRRSACATCSSELGLPSWVKTSGSKGFHIVVPLDGKAPMDRVARFANAVGTLFVSRAPDRLTQEFSKADRGGRIYVDTGRNGYSATFAAAYTVRARAAARRSRRRARGTRSSAARSSRGRSRCGTCRPASRKVGDLWADMRRRGRSLAGPAEKLRRLSR